MHTTISPIVTAAFGSSSRPVAGAFCTSRYFTGEVIPEGWWNRGMERTAELHFGTCRVARRVYVTDHGDTSQRGCWTSQRQKIGRAH